MMISTLFASQIIKGNWPYDRVPDEYRKDVDNILKAEGRDDLINA